MLGIPSVVVTSGAGIRKVKIKESKYKYALWKIRFNEIAITLNGKNLKLFY